MEHAGEWGLVASVAMSLLVEDPGPCKIEALEQPGEPTATRPRKLFVKRILAPVEECCWEPEGMGADAVPCWPAEGPPAAR